MPIPLQGDATGLRHPRSQLLALERLVLCPLARIHRMAADPAMEGLRYEADTLHGIVRNRNELDASDIALAVVIDDR